MFDGWVIAVAFLGMITGGLVLGAVADRRMPRLEAATLWATLACALTCLAAGLILAIDWVVPFGAADPEEIARVAGRSGKGGLVLVAIVLWPYVLILVGGYAVYLTSSTLLIERRRVERERVANSVPKAQGPLSQYRKD